MDPFHDHQLLDVVPDQDSLLVPDLDTQLSQIHESDGSQNNTQPVELTAAPFAQEQTPPGLNYFQSQDSPAQQSSLQKRTKQVMGSFTAPHRARRKRMRNFTVCEVCRLKKIKCDLEKPTCGGCKKSGSVCTYRAPPSSSTKTVRSDISKMADTSEKMMSTTDSLEACGGVWYAQVDALFQWPAMSYLRDITPITPTQVAITQCNNLGIPPYTTLTQEEIDYLLNVFTGDLENYIYDFNHNIQTKNPFISYKRLEKTVYFIKRSLKKSNMTSILDVQIPDELVQLPLLVIIGASAMMSKPFTARNLNDYSNSMREKSEHFELSYKLYLLADYLNELPVYRIDDLNIHSVQILLIKANYWMYNMKPWRAWEFISQSSARVVQISEQFKDPSRTFTEEEHSILEKVFHTCVRYESELRVELSQAVPPSHIINYKFPKVYPIPPLDGSMELDEELSWFYYLTEIILRRIENRILDEIYTPAYDEGSCTHFLDWSKLDLTTTSEVVHNYVVEISKVEKAVEVHLDNIIRDNEEIIAEISYPNGYPFQSVTSPSTGQSAKNSIVSPLTPGSSPLNMNPCKQKIIPETLNFIRTRLITIRILLYRPIAFCILHAPLPTEDLVKIPTVSEFLKQTSQTLEMMNVPLAVHRHYGSWIYLRNVFLSVVVAVSLYRRLKAYFATKDQLESLLKESIQIYDYWIDESPDFADARKISIYALENIDTL